MKGFLFMANGQKRMIFTPRLVEHYSKHGAKLIGVWRFNDIAPYYNCGRGVQK